MSTITIGGNGGFIASRPGETAVAIQNLTVAQTGQVSGFWTRSHFRRWRPLIGKCYDLHAYWRWLSDDGEAA